MNSNTLNDKAVENTKAQMRKGVLDLCILSIIAEAKEAYPSDILVKLREAELIVKEGTLYPLLARMKKAGWLHYTWKESDQGPPRKYYHITEGGNDFLHHLKSAWQVLVQAVDNSTAKPVEEKKTKPRASTKTKTKK